MVCACLLLGALGSLVRGDGLAEKPPPPPPPPPPHPCGPGSPHTGAVFCNISAPAADRAADLTTRLSVSEKATVISVNGGAHGGARAAFALPVAGYTECSHASGSPHGSAASPHNGWRVTVFPAVMSTASAFSRELVSSIAYAIGYETRAKHNNETGRSPKGPVGAWSGESSLYCFAPMINVCRDPRWGRCQEGNGEDPFLAHEFGRLYVQGYQDDEGTGTLKAVATPKHFDVFAGPNNAECPSPGHMANDTMPNMCNVDIGLRDWMTTFQPAFRGAIIEGNARSVMCSYNAINGVPNCGNHQLLSGLLREDWGFDGHVVSDCGGVDHIWSHHKFVKDPAEATALALYAGCDADCGHDYQQQVPTLIGNGTIDLKLLDRAVLRVLTNRMLLGELEDGGEHDPWRHLTLEALLPPHRQLARRAAREAAVLVKNKDAVLPLAGMDRGCWTVAVVGPNADSPSAYIGDYAPQPAYYTTVASAARAAVGRSEGGRVVVAPGCKDIYCNDNSSFAPAVAAAAEAAAAPAGKGLVLWVGGLNGTFNMAEGEGHDRQSLEMLGGQDALLAATHAAAKPKAVPFVVVLIGSPVAARWADANADAVIAAGYGGQEAGNAIWDIVTGQYNPSGRLSNTWPRDDAQLPPFSSYDMRAPPGGRTYQYLDLPASAGEPLYRFGGGLSYGKITFSNLVVVSAKGGGAVDVCAPIELTVDVSTAGAKTATTDVVVQVYLQFLNASVPVPRLALVQFDKLYNLTSGGGGGGDGGGDGGGRPGGSKRTARLSVQPAQRVVITNQTFVRTVEPRPVRLWVGDGQPSLPGGGGHLWAVVELSGEPTALDQCKKDK
eukprot:SAG22_NODE_1336_length_4698_cov_2.564688_2_plen_836_part_00